jgi:hypothetical protein
MSDLQGTSNPQRKEQVGAADWWFVAFVIIITRHRCDVKSTFKIPGHPPSLRQARHPLELQHQP